MDIKINQESPSNFPSVFQLVAEAFGGEDESKLIEALRQGEAFVPELSLVATVDGAVVGYILFTRIKIVDEAGGSAESLALAPLAVSPAFQQKGIGGMLVRQGLKIAQELGYHSVIVWGHKDYYPRFGFLPAKKWGISAPVPGKEDVFMGIELVENGLKNVRGTVRYPKEFGL